MSFLTGSNYSKLVQIFCDHPFKCTYDMIESVHIYPVANILLAYIMSVSKMLVKTVPQQKTAQLGRERVI